MNKIRAVIFDLDGTLYAMPKAYKPLFAIYCFPHSLKLPLYIKSREKFKGCEYNTPQEFKSALYTHFSESAKVNDAERWIEKTFTPAFIRTLRFMRNRTASINPLLSELREKGIKIALFSDFGSVVPRLKQLKIDPNSFDFILSADDIGALKPSPRPFLTISKELNIAPSEILAIGDRLDTDGEAAERSGVNFIAVDGKSNKNWSSTISALQDLPDVTE